MMSRNLADRIHAESFREWYREREWARNIRQGNPYFNGPSPVPPVEKHSPSQLVQCHRKLYYRKENAPAERPAPEGIFWAGRRFEEDVVQPYLQSLVHDDQAYVSNSMWIDLEARVDDQELRFRGATDPCIVDREGDPLLPTEVKTKEEVEHLDEPNRHHRAQVHAYMRGLSEKHDRSVQKAVVIYGSRKRLSIRAFHVEFDPDFWREVLEWASDHSTYRENRELPPAEPEFGWECQYCDYRHRCGQSDRGFSDEPPEGLLPGVADYPRERVVEYLRSHDDARLTPTLAGEYPDLADAYAVSDWECGECGMQYAWDEPNADPDSDARPVCPSCADRGTLSTLDLVGLG